MQAGIGIQGSTRAIVLAGGRGTRVQHLYPNLPKPLIPVAGKPWLYWVLSNLSRQGLSSVVVSSGYRSAQIQDFARNVKLPGIELICVAEDEPLGTAGGFVNVCATVPSLHEHSLICNGDSLALADLTPLFASLESTEIDGAMLALPVDDAARYGTLDVTTDGHLLGFAEKRPSAGIINAGVYLFKNKLLPYFPENKPLSFEYDVFPSLLMDGVKIKVVTTAAPFLDIGTEASLACTEDFITNNMDWFK